MKYNWKYSDNTSNNYYHDENGMILGEITRVNYSDDIWYAEVDVVALGRYVNNKSAKKAVEEYVNSVQVTSVTEDFNPRNEYANGYSGKSPLTPMWESNNNSMLGENH